MADIFTHSSFKVPNLPEKKKKIKPRQNIAKKPSMAFSVSPSGWLIGKHRKHLACI